MHHPISIFLVRTLDASTSMVVFSKEFLRQLKFQLESWNKTFRDSTFEGDDCVLLRSFHVLLSRQIHSSLNSNVRIRETKRFSNPIHKRLNLLNFQVFGQSNDIPLC